MPQIERVGVSLEKDLLNEFDKLITQKGYQNRSKAIRDLIRQQLSSERVSNEKADGVAAVVLVYDHHATALMERMTELQHSHLLQTISSLHVHLGHHDCLEVIVLRGKVGEINKMGEKLISIKGVKLGKINLLAADAV
jgi:CopG family transcriptional regulator, nickel-responsive regulator